jgi:hypothetical protein
VLDFMGHGASLWTSAGPVRICEGSSLRIRRFFSVHVCEAKRAFPRLREISVSDGHFVSDGHLDTQWPTERTLSSPASLKLPPLPAQWWAERTPSSLASLTLPPASLTLPVLPAQLQTEGTPALFPASPKPPALLTLRSRTL